jgi:hypothetical protein
VRVPTCGCTNKTGEGFPQNALYDDRRKVGKLFDAIEAPDHHEEEARVVDVALCCVAMVVLNVSR